MVVHILGGAAFACLRYLRFQMFFLSVSKQIGKINTADFFFGGKAKYSESALVTINKFSVQIQTEYGSR